jgi:hypothetical protein
VFAARRATTRKRSCLAVLLRKRAITQQRGDLGVRAGPDATHPYPLKASEPNGTSSSTTSPPDLYILRVRAEMSLPTRPKEIRRDGKNDKP